MTYAEAEHVLKIALSQWYDDKTRDKALIEFEADAIVAAIEAAEERGRLAGREESAMVADRYAKFQEGESGNYGLGVIQAKIEGRKDAAQKLAVMFRSDSRYMGGGILMSQQSETDVRNERVMAYLRELYGGDPVPLRSYLEPKEALLLMARHGKQPLFEDMDFLHYPSKFRQAVEDGIRAGRDPSTWAFWHAARLAFLEYGGCYREGHEPPRNE